MIAMPNTLIAANLETILPAKGKVLKHVRLELDPVQSTDLQVMVLASCLDMAQEEYEASLSLHTETFGQGQNGLEIITEAKLGTLVAIEEGAVASPSCAEEIVDLFLEGCINIDQVATYLPKRGANVVTRQLVKGVRMIRRVGKFFC